eukprot:TRINITY_DN664_c0_g4_i1.p1 TRINITY_DN664_c0_g4~~TRINITY_DN664_c0_g4_i1.p1  ORF type:complete len:181 (+),score=79.43 TRINITY_DN664_c0_g4_i1:63-605(+)
MTGKEIEMAKDSPPRAYVAQCIDLFEGGEKTVTLKGRGQAIAKVVNVAEVVKRRVKGLCQISSIESLYEARKGEADQKKYTAGMKITLSLDQLDKSAPGYQDPVPEEEVQEEDKARREPSSTKKPKKGGKSGGGRGRGAGKGAAAAGKGGKAGGGRGSGGRGGGRGASATGATGGRGNAR